MARGVALEDQCQPVGRPGPELGPAVGSRELPENVGFQQVAHDLGTSAGENVGIERRARGQRATNIIIFDRTRPTCSAVESVLQALQLERVAEE